MRFHFFAPLGAVVAIVAVVWALPIIIGGLIDGPVGAIAAVVVMVALLLKGR